MCVYSNMCALRYASMCWSLWCMEVLVGDVKAVLGDKRFVRYLYIAIGLSALMVGLCLAKCMVGSRVESIAKRANHEVVLSYGAVKV